MDEPTLTPAEEAGLRRRLHALATEEPVEEIWDTLQQRMSTQRAQRGWSRRRVAMVAAVMALAAGVYTYAGPADDDSRVETVDDERTTTTERDGGTSSTTEDTVHPHVEPDDDAPSTTAVPTSGQPGGSPSGADTGPGNDPNPGAGDETGAGAPRPSNPTAPPMTDPPLPDVWEMSVDTSPDLSIYRLEVSSITPCPTPSWALWSRVRIEIWHDGALIVTDSPFLYADGTWDQGVEDRTADWVPGDYEVRATCGAWNPDHDAIDELGTYIPHSVTLTP